MLPVTLPVPLTAALVVVDFGDAVVVLPVPLTAVLVVLEAGAVPAVPPLGAAVLVGVLPVPFVATGALVPLAAVPEPLTVEALTVVDPEAFTSPEPLFVAVTVVEPAALVVAFVGLAVGVLAPMLRSSTGAAVPLAAVPEPLTVAAFTVVEPAALMAPEPLPVALTVVDPDASVMAVCANAAAPGQLSSAALTAAAITLFRCCNLLIVIMAPFSLPWRSFSLTVKLLGQHFELELLSGRSARKRRRLI